MIFSKRQITQFRKSLTAFTVVLICITGLSLFNYKDLKVGLYETDNSIIDCPGCNLVVILVDTLRADHLPFYGYKQDTAPFLTELAEKSSVFERAFSSSSWTAPATASVFTSVLPSQHGVITGFAATQSQKRRNTSFELNRIPEKLETLPEFASKIGFETIGVADNLNIGNEIGFDRGFSKFKKFRYRGAAAVNQKADEFISLTDKSRPYFLYLHYMDPHEPYSRKNTWYEQCINTYGNNKRNRTLCAYDSEINFTDKKISQLFKKHDWLNNSVVIFLSDHGEEFHDHGQDGHGKTLYTEMIHVPLLIYHPAWTGRRIKRNVHTIDILPTVAGLTSTPGSSVWAGRNLVSVIHKEAQEDQRLIISERLRSKNSRFNWAKQSVIREDLHLIKTSSLTGETLQTELYNLTDDFYEKHDISSVKPDTTIQMSALLSKENSILPENTDSTVEIEADPELLKELRSLGYLD